MQTVLLDRDDWEDLVQAALKAHGCLKVLEKMWAEKCLRVMLPESTEAAERQRLLDEFEVMLSGNREGLQEALIPFEDEVPGEQE